MFWVWKCFKMAFWELPGPILRPGLGNAPKWLSGGFLRPFCGLGLEMLKISFWVLPASILRPGLGKTSTMAFWGFMGPFCGLGLEML